MLKSIFFCCRINRNCAIDAEKAFFWNTAALSLPQQCIVWKHAEESLTLLLGTVCLGNSDTCILPYTVFLNLYHRFSITSRSWDPDRCQQKFSVRWIISRFIYGQYFFQLITGPTMLILFMESSPYEIFWKTSLCYLYKNGSQWLGKRNRPATRQILHTSESISHFHIFLLCFKVDNTLPPPKKNLFYSYLAKVYISS